MAIISSFLCWSNTRTGSAVCGYYTLAISVVCLAFYMLRYIALDEMDDSIELKGIVYAGFVLYSFLIGVSLILLPGVHMDRKFLLLPWIYVLVITVLYETGAIALITTVHLEQDNTLNAWEIVAVVFYCLRLLANCYCFACVVSQYQELSEGRGTYEFLYKPRRRHLGLGAGLSDLEEYNPPYGASLPPYSLENPYKEYSPPTYENLGLHVEDLDAANALSRARAVLSSSQREQNGGVRSYLADVIVNRPPAEDAIHLDLTGEEYGASCYDSAYFPESSHHYCLQESCDSNNDIEDVEGSGDSHSQSQDLIENCFPQDYPHHYHHCHHQHHEPYSSCEHSRHLYHQYSHSDSDAIAMTSSSGQHLDHISVNNLTRNHSMKHERTSESLKIKRVQRSPLTIQKRTYITWI